MINECVFRLKDVFDYCLQLLINEINARSFFSIQKWNRTKELISRLTESFATSSYNSVPPIIMELMNDMRGFSEIVGKYVRIFVIPLIDSYLLRKFIFLEIN